MNLRRGFLRAWLTACCVWLPIVTVWGYWEHATAYNTYRIYFAASDLEQIFWAERGVTLYSAIAACTTKCKAESTECSMVPRLTMPGTEKICGLTCEQECTAGIKTSLVTTHPWRVFENFIAYNVKRIWPTWALYGLLPIVILLVLVTVGVYPAQWIARGFDPPK